MKAYKINKNIQLLMAFSAITLIIMSLVQPSFIILLLWFQSILGISQYLGGWVLMYFFPEDTQLKRYLILSSVNLLLIPLSFFMEKIIDFNGVSIIIIVLAIPWLIAIFYWTLSFKTTQRTFLI